MEDKETGISRREFLMMAGTALFASLPVAAFAADAGAPLKIGTIGAGKIGSTVGELWVKSGHPVLFSSRHPEEITGLVARLGSLARAGTVPEAIAFGDAMLLAVPYGAMPQIAKDYAAALKGKIVIDAGNAVATRDGAIADEVERDGIGVTTQKFLPGARIVRAFNTLSYTIFAREANRPDPKLAVPIAGDDADAVKVVAGLVRDAGFEPVIVGKLADARRFQRGSAGYGLAVSAAELRQKLSVTP